MCLLCILLGVSIIVSTYFVSRTQTLFFPQNNFAWFLTCMTIASLAYWRLANLAKTHFSFQQIIIFAVVIRLLLLVVFPNLSDDFWRYLWDGQLMNEGRNAFAHTPLELFKKKELSAYLAEIYPQLNSKTYFSVYPPVAQYLFGIANFLGGGHILYNIIFLRIGVILAEILLFFGLKKLLLRQQLPSQLVAWYALNPMVILAFTVNLHLEVFMIAALLWGTVFLQKNSLLPAAFCWTMAIGVKILPLMFLPLLVRRMKWQHFLAFVALILLGLVLLFVPFGNKSANILQSLRLYYGYFEFNASIFYLVRYVGYQVFSHDIVRWAAPLLALLTALGIVVYALKEKNPEIKNFPAAVLFAAILHLLLSPLVHPWYVVGWVAFAALTQKYCVILWSLVVVLSYSAYTYAPVYQESYLAIALEYGLVAVCVWRSITRKNILI